MVMNAGNPTFIVGAADIGQKLLVKKVAGLLVVNTETETDVPLGATLYAAKKTEPVAVQLLNNSGTIEMTCAGAIAEDVDVFAADAGKIQVLPVGAGDYLKVGRSNQAGSADGSIIEVIPNLDRDVVTVT